MKVRAIVLTLIIALLASFGVFAQEENGTIADVVTAYATGDAPEFTSLLAAIEAADPSVLETLSNPDAQLTVFAPTDAAFAELPSFVTDYLMANTDVLTQVLTYHVVDGAYLSADVLGMIDELGNAVIPTLNGAELTLSADLDTLTVKLDQATIVLEMIDIAASNGVIHVIDSVLVPPVELTYEPPAFVEGSVAMAGSSTVGPLTEVIMFNYREEAGGDAAAIELTNDITGTGGGFDRFCGEGVTDLSNASRAIKDDEVAECQAIGREPIEFRVGTDALSVVVNPAADWIEDVTVEELAQLLGTATTWADVREGWPNEPIIRYTPGTESGTFDFFNEVVFEEDETIPLAASNLTTNNDDNVLLLGVAENQYAIGYFGYAYYVNNSDSLKLLRVNGIEANAETVEASGDAAYPLARPLFIYGAASIFAEKPVVGEFVRYYLATVNDVIGEVGYFPANPFRLNIAKLEIIALTN